MAGRRFLAVALAFAQLSFSTLAGVGVSSLAAPRVAEAGARTTIIMAAVVLAVRTFGSQAGHAALARVLSFASNPALRAEVRAAIQQFAARNPRYGNAAGQVLGKFDDEVLRFQANVSSRMPYNPRIVEGELRATYGQGAVRSNTVPPANGPNVRQGGGSVQSGGTRVPYDGRGYPIFDNVARFDTRLPRNSFNPQAGRNEHMAPATRNLREAIGRGEVPPGTFTPQELAAINAGRPQIPNYVWHHHQDFGRMQLVPTRIHEGARHVGGYSMHQ